MPPPRVYCPDCGSFHSKRCEIVYEQGSSTITGPNFDTQRTSSFADRASPPTPPQVAWHWLTSLLMTTLGALFVLTGLSDWSWPALIIGVACVFFAHPHQHLPPYRQQVRTEMAAFERNMALYKKLWICLDCGKVFKPS